MTISLAYATASGIDWLCNLSLALTTCEHRGSWRCCTYIYIPPLGITCRGWAWHFIAITCTVISQPLWPQCTTIKLNLCASPPHRKYYSIKTGAQGGPSNCASKSRSQNEAPIKCKTWPGSRCFFMLFSGPRGVESGHISLTLVRDCLNLLEILERCSWSLIHEVDFCLISFSILVLVSWASLPLHAAKNANYKMFCRSSQDTFTSLQNDIILIYKPMNASIDCIPSQISTSIKWKHGHLNHVHHKIKRL